MKLLQEETLMRREVEMATVVGAGSVLLPILSQEVLHMVEATEATVRMATGNREEKDRDLTWASLPSRVSSWLQGRVEKQ